MHTLLPYSIWGTGGRGAWRGDSRGFGAQVKVF